MTARAKSHGKDVFYSVRRRLFEAYLCERLNIGDPEILKTLAFEAGITKEAVEQAWNDPIYETRLQQNLKAALELDVSGTPTFFIGKRKLVGALPTDTLFRVARAN
ncbi:MAG: DsbA family protein [Pseudomonadota bacterium]|nr:DsbA family protein [Pseudomonadota bacterium]